MSAHRSFSGRCLQDGMAPRPVLIFQNSSPSDSSWTRLEVQSAGLGFSATAAAPSPLPLLPWQDTQLTLATFSPCSATFALAAIGLFLAFSDAGAVQGVWPQAVPARASPRPAIATRARMVSDDIVESSSVGNTGLRTA